MFPKATPIVLSLKNLLAVHITHLNHSICNIYQAPESLPPCSPQRRQSYFVPHSATILSDQGAEDLSAHYTDLPQLPRPYPSRPDSKRNIPTQVSQVHTIHRHTPRHIHGYAESLRTHTPGSTYKDTHTCKRTQELKYTHVLLNACPHVHNHTHKPTLSIMTGMHIHA